jgi:hypothetical protein
MARSCQRLARYESINTVPARKGALNKARRRTGADSVDSGRLHTMHKTTLALQLLLCVGSPWAIGIQVRAAETPAPDSAPANAAASGDGAQREWRERLRRPPAGSPGNSLFETKSWLPEPPPQRPVVRAPEPPRAPPFPYQFLGRLETEGKPRTVYLTKGNEVYAAMPGEVIEGTYRVVDVTAESMEVTYLPLNMKQQIAFSSIVPPAARQAGRAPSDTPAIVAPTSVSIPPPMSISPPTAQGTQGEVLPPIPTPRTVQRQSAYDQAGRPNAPQPQQQQQQQQPQQQPRPQQAGTAAPVAGAPGSTPAAPAPVSSLSPSPVVVSPPTLSAFGSTAPAQTPPAGAPQTTGAAPAPAPPGSAAPSAPPAGRM